MTTRLIMFVFALGSASLAGCDGGGSGSGGGGGGMAAQTVSAVVAQEISQNTADDSVPIEINDLPLSDEDTDDTSHPDPVF